MYCTYALYSIEFAGQIHPKSTTWSSWKLGISRGLRYVVYVSGTIGEKRARLRYDHGAHGGGLEEIIACVQGKAGQGRRERAWGDYISRAVYGALVGGCEMLAP